MTPCVPKLVWPLLVLPAQCKGVGGEDVEVEVVEEGGTPTDPLPLHTHTHNAAPPVKILSRCEET